MSKSLKKIIAIVMSVIMLISTFGMTTSAVTTEDVVTGIAESAEEMPSKDYSKYIVMDDEEYNMFSIAGIAKSIEFAKRSDENKNYILYNYVGYLLNGVVSALASIIPDPKGFYNKDEYVSENFLTGNGEFIDEAAEGASWSLGYANASLVPQDWETRNYFLGGYIDTVNLMWNRIETVLDDMKVRIIVLDDGSGRGKSVFATIDSIGLSNSDVRDIRAMMSEYAEENNISTINVFTTHVHSCVDTQGLWTNNIYKVLTNLTKSLTRVGELKKGADEVYLEFLKETVTATMIKACNNMEKGTMTYAKKDIGEDYFENKNRPTASSFDTNLYRLVFTPDNKRIAPTIIANLGAHPYVAGLSSDSGAGTGRELSGDYVYYWGSTLAEAGYNFMFFNGAIAGIYEARSLTNDGFDIDRFYKESARYGVEMAKITLGMTMTEEEIDADEFLADKETVEKEMAESENYTLWYEDWEPVEEVAVNPILNIILKEVTIPVTNPVIELVGKLNLANYDIVIDDNGNYSVTTEIGYLEIGKDFKVAMVPGEMCPDIANGGTSLSKEYAFNKKDFEYPTIAEALGEEEIIIFGLANDAIGYIVPDNDYARTIIDGDAHYHETISLGKYVASVIVKGFIEINEEIH